MDTFSTNEEQLNLDYLKQVCFGKEEIFKDMIAIFLKNTPNQMKQLYDNLQNKDWQSFKSIAHQLKSSVTVMGMHAAAEDLQYLEDLAIKKTDLHEIPNILDRVNVQVNSGIKQLDLKLKSL